MEGMKRGPGAMPARWPWPHGASSREAARHVARAVDLGAEDLLEGRVGWDRLRPSLERSLVALDVVARHGGDRRLRVDIMDLPQLGLSWLDVAGVEMCRTARMAAGSCEGYTLSFALSGSFQASQGGADIVCDAGAGVLLDGMRESRVSVPDSTRFVGIRLGPQCRDLVSDLLRRRAGTLGQVLSVGNPAFAALRAFVRELADPRLPLVDSLAPMVHGRVLALVEAALSGSDGVVALQGLRDASLELIHRHLDDPTLSAADLAGWLGASEEQVLCALAGDQSEAASMLFRAMLTRLRVVALARRLREPASARTSIEVLSLESGFLDEQIAREAFISAFGIEPELWRTMRLA